MGLVFDGISVPGTVTKQFVIGDNGVRSAPQYFPGLNGVMLVRLGVVDAMIRVPIVVWGTSVATLAQMESLLYRLKARRKLPQSGVVTVETGQGSRVIRDCVLEEIVEQSDIIKDDCGTMGNSCVLRLVLGFRQVRPA